MVFEQLDEFRSHLCKFNDYASIAIQSSKHYENYTCSDTKCVLQTITLSAVKNHVYASSNESAVKYRFCYYYKEVTVFRRNIQSKKIIFCNSKQQKLSKLLLLWF